MSRQGSSFHGHRERREGHQKQYGIGSWYGADDYYAAAPSSSDFGTASKRYRYNERYKDRYENADDGMPFPSQDSDYGLYTDFSSVSDKDTQLPSSEPDVARNYSGSRKPSSEYHIAHRMPKTVWSSEESTYPTLHTSGMQVRHHIGSPYESSYRVDESNSWRPHGHLSKNPDFRTRSASHSEYERYGTNEPRHLPSHRSEEGRVTFGARGRMFFSNKLKGVTERDFQKSGPPHSRHGRKYSESESSQSGIEIHDHATGLREYYPIKKSFNPMKSDGKAMERQDTETGAKLQRSDESRDKHFEKFDRKYQLSHGDSPHKALIPTTISDDYGDRHIERKRPFEKTDLSVPANQIICEAPSHLERPHFANIESATDSYSILGSYNQEKATAVAAKVENISPVAGHVETQYMGRSFQGAAGLLTVEQPSTESSGLGLNNFDIRSAVHTVNMVESAKGNGGGETVNCPTENCTSVTAPNICNEEMPAAVDSQPPETEEEVISKLDSMDKEIVECEEDIKNLGVIQQQLEKELNDLKIQMEETEDSKDANDDSVVADKIHDPKDELVDFFFDKFRPKNFELISKIYKDNQMKAKVSHAQLWSSDFNSHPQSKPLYYQPSDLPFYFDNIRRHKRFRMKLVKFLQIKKLSQIKKDEAIKQQYEKQKDTWLKKLERIESNIKRKAKLAKVRAFYEREFPEIKRQREQQERMTRFGARTTWGPLARSEAEFEEIVDNLSELEATEKQMHQLAVEPPKLFDKYERRVQYSNKNGLIRDVEAFERERKFENIWCEEEKIIFKERFTQFPKDFEKIAEGLKRKTVSECVLYYYRNKKKENFKGSSKKPNKRTGRLQRQLVSTLTYAQPLPNIQNLQQPQPIKTRQKEREREKAREQEIQKEQSKEKEKSLRLEQDSNEKTEMRPTRELRSNFDKLAEPSDVAASNEIVTSKMITPQMESQCKQSVDELIARYLARKPLPAENVDPSRWSELEISKAINGLKCHGRNWPAIAKMVSTKSEAQCKNFYFNYKRKFHLESILGISKHNTVSYPQGSAAEDEITQKRRRSKRTSQQDSTGQQQQQQETVDGNLQDKSVDVVEMEGDHAGESAVASEEGRVTRREVAEKGDQPGLKQEEQDEIFANVTQKPNVLAQKEELAQIDHRSSKEEPTQIDHRLSKNDPTQMGLGSNQKEPAETVVGPSKSINDKQQQKQKLSSEEISVVKYPAHVLDPKQINTMTMEKNMDEGKDNAALSQAVIYKEASMVDFTTREPKDSEKLSSDAEHQVKRPDSLPLSFGAPEAKLSMQDECPPRPLPPPLTPVFLSKVGSQILDAQKAHSPRSLLKGISLQGEIGAFKETLERTLEKKNDLSSKEGGPAFEGEKEKMFQGQSQYHQHPPNVRLMQLPTNVVHVKQQMRNETEKNVDPFPFVPASTRHPSLEQSAAIQAFTVRQPSLMSAQKHPMTQFPHLPQDAASMPKHFQHSIAQIASGTEGTPVRPSSAPIEVGHSIRPNSPKATASLMLETRDHSQYAFSRQNQFVYQSAASVSSVQTMQSITQTRKDMRPAEPIYSSIVDYHDIPELMPRQGVPRQGNPHQGMPHQGIPYQGMPHQRMTHQGMTHQGMPYQGILYSNPAHPGEILIRPNEHFKQHQQRPRISPAEERQLARPYLDKHYPLSANEMRPRTYGEMLERAASIPSLSVSRTSTSESAISKALSKENIPYSNAQARLGEQKLFGVERLKGKPTEARGFDVMVKKRDDQRHADRRDSMFLDSMLLDADSNPLHKQHIRQRACTNSRPGQVGNEERASIELAVTQSPVAMEHRILHYLPGSIAPGSIAPGSIAPGSIAPGSIAPGSIAPGSIAPGSIAPGSIAPGSIVPFGRDFRPSLDQQLLQNIDGMKMANIYHSAPSAIHQHTSRLERSVLRSNPMSGKDDFQGQTIPHYDQRGEMSDTCEGQKRVAKLDARSAPQGKHPRSSSGVENQEIPRSFNTNSLDFSYGISTGLVQRVGPRMSITGSRQQFDEAQHTWSHEQTSKAMEADAARFFSQKEAAHFHPTSFVKRADTIKNQSKNTRPSSVDSVIHKSFFSERHQQLSSSLGDLRNLTALHLSPTLPLSPVSSKQTSFLFRPWEKEDKDGVEEGDHTHREDGPNMKSLTIITDSRKEESAQDEALMSPTIPYTDPARDTPVKDMISPEDDDNQSNALRPDENVLQVASQLPTNSQEFLNVPTKSAIDQNQQSCVTQLVNLSSETVAAICPTSPIDSEATLSADEAEMELMSESLREYENCEGGRRGKRKADERGKYVREADEKWAAEREAAERQAVDIQAAGRQESGREAYEREAAERDLNKTWDNKLNSGKERNLYDGSRLVAEMGLDLLKISTGPKEERIREDKESSSRGIGNTFENQKNQAILETIADEQEEKCKPKGRKKQKMAVKGKKKSPKEIDKTLLPTKETVKITKSVQISSAVRSVFPVSPSPKLPTLSSAPNSCLKDSVLKEIDKPTETLDENQGKNLMKEISDGDHVVSHDSQTIVDVEETSAAIDSIQNEREESPSAEEDVAEPFLTLWPSAEGYACEAQSVSTAEESDYQQSYDIDMNERREFSGHMAEEKVLREKNEENFTANFINLSQLTGHSQPGTGDQNQEMDVDLEARLALVANSSLQQVHLPSQREDAMFIPAFETISPPGSPISPVETQDAKGELPVADTVQSFAHSVLSLNIPVTSQSSPKTHMGGVAFPYSTLSFTIGSMPASRSGSLHGSRSSSACPSPNTLTSIHNSPSASGTGLISRADFPDSMQSIPHGDNLSHLTERLLNNDVVIPHDENVTLAMEFSSNRTSEAGTISTENFCSAIEYEPLSDED